MARGNRSNDTLLRPVADGDLPVFFQHQLDAAANHMAAFTAKDPADRAGFDAHWAAIRSDGAVKIRTIVFEGRVAGWVASFERLGEPEVGYWVGREYWGRGIATRALSLLLEEVSTRPLFARAARDNAASLRVLEKCGFRVIGQGRYFANARGVQIEELILKLEADL